MHKQCKKLFNSKTSQGKIAILALVFEAAKLVYKSNPYHHIDHTTYTCNVFQITDKRSFVHDLVVKSSLVLLNA